MHKLELVSYSKIISGSAFNRANFITHLKLHELLLNKKQLMQFII